MSNVVKLDSLNVNDITISMSVRKNALTFYIHNKATGANRIIWRKKYRSTKTKPSEAIAYATNVARELTTLIRESSKDNIHAIFAGDKAGLVRRYVNYIFEQMREDVVKRRSGIVYDRDGWRIYHPVPTVWIITTPMYFGTVTALGMQDKQQFRIDVTPTGKAKSTTKYNDLREGLYHGIRALYQFNNTLLDINKLHKVLDEAGIGSDSPGVLSIRTHTKLQQYIQDLTAAAYHGGEKELVRKLKELAAKE